MITIQLDFDSTNKVRETNIDATSIDDEKVRAALSEISNEAQEHDIITVRQGGKRDAVTYRVQSDGTLNKV